MATRTVLNESKTDVTTYTSGILAVGDVHELIIDVEVTGGSGGTPDGCINVDNPCYFQCFFDFMRLTVTGSFVGIGSVSFYSQYPFEGTPVYPSGLQSNIVESGFGDRIQIDLRNPENITLSFTVSVLGK